MPAVEFLYFEDCPSHELALALLKENLIREGFDPSAIQVIEIKTEDEAELYQFYGSPTIRIDGADIAPLPDGIDRPGLLCRAYRKSDGKISPLPPPELIQKALQSAKASG